MAEVQGSKSEVGSVGGSGMLRKQSLDVFWGPVKCNKGGKTTYLQPLTKLEFRSVTLVWEEKEEEEGKSEGEVQDEEEEGKQWRREGKT